MFINLSIWLELLFFVFIFTTIQRGSLGSGETLLRRPQSLSISTSNTFDPSIDKIHDAVELWCINPTLAERTYGHISNWNTNGITDMSKLFYTSFSECHMGDMDPDGFSCGCSEFNENINDWDVSSVTDMSGTFYGATTFNKPLNAWDVSSVTSMSEMFGGDYFGGAFNQPLNNWNVSSVTDMSRMFMWHTTFNQPLDNWDVSNVTDMNSMFAWAGAFNQPLNSWDVSSVTTVGGEEYDMGFYGWNDMMFQGASSFQQCLSSWKRPLCASCTDCRYGKWGSSGDLWHHDSGMNTGLFGFIESMSSYCTSDSSTSAPSNSSHTFDPSLDSIYDAVNRYCDDPICTEYSYGHISNWNTTGITNMSALFSGQRHSSCITFNQSLNDWDVSSVTNMESMFAVGPLDVDYQRGMEVPPSFNQPLNNWNVSSVTNMKSMFYGALSFNQPLNDWDVSSVTNMESMFALGDPYIFDYAMYLINMGMEWSSSFNQPLNNWNVSSVTNMKSMFHGSYLFNQPLNDWDVSSVTNMESMFALGAPRTYYSMMGMEVPSSFNQPLNKWDVSSVINMKSMFHRASSFNQPLNDWDVSSVTNMESMFAGDEEYYMMGMEAPSSFNQPLNNWDVSSVTNMKSMFHRASSFNQPLNDWDISSVTNMQDLFDEDSSFEQCLESWKNQVSEYCTNCDAVISRLDCNCPSGPSYCFEFSPSIHYIHGAVREWCDDPTRAESKYGHISNWNTNGITDMSRLFSHCGEFNENINNWDVSSVTDMTDLFEMASSFNQPLDSWDVSSVRNMEGTFNDAYSFNQPLNSWDVSSVTNMDGLFHNAMMFNQPLDSWDVSSVTNMDQIFEGSSFNQCLDAWEDKVHDHCYGCHDVIRASCNRDDMDGESHVNMDGESHVTYYDDGAGQNYEWFKSSCVNKGQSLCKFSELCPNGGPYQEPYGGLQAHTDMWCPILPDPGEGGSRNQDWVQIGTRDGGMCNKHSSFYDESHPHECCCGDWCNSNIDVEWKRIYACCGPVVNDSPSDDRSSSGPVIIVVVVAVIVFNGIIWYYSYSKTHQRHHPFAVLQDQQPELQLPRAQVQLSTIPMAQVDTNVKLNSFCGNCGSPLNADSKFCGNCGAAIKDIE